MRDPEEVLRFWFPAGHAEADEATMRAQLAWWFQGGADPEVVARFVPLLEEAARGEHDGWAATARGRLALILVLDQFPRSAYRASPQTYAQDDQAIALALAGLDAGDFERLGSIWEQTFFVLPLFHSERLKLHERGLPYVEAMVAAAPPQQQRLAAFSLSQARGHHDVVARFGRHPHRNAILGRESTPEELEWLAAGQLVHKREPPPVS